MLQRYDFFSLTRKIIPCALVAPSENIFSCSDFLSCFCTIKIGNMETTVAYTNQILYRVADGIKHSKLCGFCIAAGQ